MNHLERHLRGAFEDAHAVAQSELGFGMPMLLRMADERGAAQAARATLASEDDTFTKLFMCGRLDISVEAIVLREVFRPLFTDVELQCARERLLASNYEMPEAEDCREHEVWAKLARKARSQWAAENPY